MVVDHDQALGLGHVTGSQLLPAQYVADGQARAAPGDDVLGPGAVLPVGLEVCGGDGRAVLEDRVLAQLHRPDSIGVVDLVAYADVWTDHTGLVDLVDRPVHPRREDPLPAAVTPGSNPAMTVRDPDLLRILQLRPRRHDRRRIHWEHRRARRRRYGRGGWNRRRRGCSRGRRRWRWRRLCGWPHRRLDDDRLDDGRRHGRGRLRARRGQRERRRNQHKAHEATEPAPERVAVCGHGEKLFHEPPSHSSSCRPRSHMGFNASERLVTSRPGVWPHAALGLVL